jgi:hypothetical protein
VALLATVNAGEPDSTATTLLDCAVVFDVALEPGIVRSTSADGTQPEGDVTNVTLAIPRSQAERVAHETSPLVDARLPDGSRLNAVTAADDALDPRDRAEVPAARADAGRPGRPWHAQSRGGDVP